MQIISENIHIISDKVREAILNRDEAFITELVKKQIKTSPDWLDLNIGPAKKNFSGSMKWLVDLIRNITHLPLSFDSTNPEEILSGLKSVKYPDKCIINSASADPERLEVMSSLAAEYGSYLIALTLNNEIGIPKMADERLELAFSIIEATAARGIDNGKIIFDPLILPVCVEQSQVLQALDTIRMFKASFESEVLTTIGLSNVSNGMPKEVRPLMNRVLMVLMAGCGLDMVIADSLDEEFMRINKILKTEECEKSYDKLLISLKEMMLNFGELEDLSYNKNDLEEAKIYKTAEILLNKKIYSHSYLEI